VFFMYNCIVALTGALGITIGAAMPAAAQDVLTAHRLSAALASEAVTEAVATCAKQGYRVAATIIDTDGVTQAMLRGDGAGLIAVSSSYDKAYTVLLLGAARNEDSSAAIAKRIGPTPPAGGVAKLLPSSTTSPCNPARFASSLRTRQSPRLVLVALRAAISTKRVLKRGSTRSAHG
jgi:uncharacterized protein GlcG (DUF336 family)